VMTGPEQVENEIVGIVQPAVFEGRDLRDGGIIFSQVLGELHRAVYGVIVANEAAEKTDDDGRRGRSLHCRWRRWL
jgi:hypothetical protein